MGVFLLFCFLILLFLFKINEPVSNSGPEVVYQLNVYRNMWHHNVLSRSHVHLLS